MKIVTRGDHIPRKKKSWGGKPPSNKPRKGVKRGIRTKEPLTDEQQEVMLKIAKEIGDFEYKTVLLLLDTGMHPCVLSNDCEETDPNLRVWENKFIQWTRPKNGEPISMMIPERIRGWIDDYLKSERPNYRQWYNRLLKEVGQRAKIKGLSPLTLRHTFAINRLNQGYTLGELQDMMGTKDLKSLAHYTRYSKTYMEKRYKGKEW